jgi:hypothetical protein
MTTEQWQAVGSPGPWYVDMGEIYDANSVPVVFMNVRDELFNVADANLIAAAPDLLAALKKHLPWQRNGEPDRPPQGWGIWQDAVDAIAKAEGVTMEGTNGKERSLD